MRSDSRLKSIFSSRLFIIFAVFLLLFLSVAYARAYYQNYQVEQEIGRLRSEAKRLEAKKIETLDLLKYVQSPSYVE